MRSILIESKGFGLAAPRVGVNKKVVVIMCVGKENQPIEACINLEIIRKPESTLELNKKDSIKIGWIFKLITGVWCQRVPQCIICSVLVILFY